MRHQLLIIATTLFSTVQFVASWGADTHPTIGYLAERFLLNESVWISVLHCVDTSFLLLKRFSRMNLNFMDRWAAQQIGLTDKVATTQIVDGTSSTQMISNALPFSFVLPWRVFHSELETDMEVHRSIVPSVTLGIVFRRDV